MSQMVSPSTSRSYGLARVTRAWNISRAGVYRFRKASGSHTLICYSACKIDPHMRGIGVQN